jgi:hypothetical protein
MRIRRIKTMDRGSTSELPREQTKFVRGAPYIVAKSDNSAFWHWIPAIKITTWKPMTHYEAGFRTARSTTLSAPADCACTINYWWDRRLAPEERTHEYCSEADALRLRADLLYRPLFGGGIRHRAIKSFRWHEETCEIHRGLSGPRWFETLLEENRTWNMDRAKAAGMRNDNEREAAEARDPNPLRADRGQ